MAAFASAMSCSCCSARCVGCSLCFLIILERHDLSLELAEILDKNERTIKNAMSRITGMVVASMIYSKI
jgi:hypothetical protein